MPSLFPIAIIVQSLAGGGVERVSINLARSLADKGHSIDIVLLSAHGDYRDESFSRFSFYYVNLRRSSPGLLNYFREHNVRAQRLIANPLSGIFAEFALKKRWANLRVNRNLVRRSSGVRRYILMRRPKAILARGYTATLAALSGRHLSGTSPPIAASLHGAPERWNPRERSDMREMLPEADAVVSVSQGVAASAIRNCGIEAGKSLVVYNPLNPDIPRLRGARVGHPWFRSGAVPVILMVARISPQKDFATLLSAFALICDQRDTRLVVVAPEGRSEASGPLISQATELGIREKVDILGFDQNPYRYMHKADCFVLSTFYEGLPGVLIEAMACGTPVVSSDAPYGPSEILEGGKWGKLVPVGDASAMARAILETLDGDRPSASELVERSRFFSADRATAAYEKLIDRVTGKTHPRST